MSHDNVGCKTTMADMNRRNVLLGLGTAAAGSGIVFGSGAFNQIEADRSLDINVDNDTGGLVEISSESQIVTVDENLAIDSDEIADGTEGFNTDAEVQIGADSGGIVGSGAVEFDSNFNDSVFDNTRVDVTFEVTSEPGTFDGSADLVLDPAVGSPQFLDLTVDTDDVTIEGFASDTDPEAPVTGGFFIDADEGDDNIDTNLRITAEQVDD